MDHSRKIKGLQFLKLGGSLITEKNRPSTSRPEIIQRIAREIADAWQQSGDLRLILGHGSGSFGHVPAKQYGTRAGASTIEQWRGFVAVWREAAMLNQQVMAALSAAGVPALAFPPSAMVVAHGGKIATWDIHPIRLALQAGLLPVVYGDVAFDVELGATILSTEDLFMHLTKELQPERILLAGIEAGVWEHYPQRNHLIAEITPSNISKHAGSLGESAAVDVTGGMESKVRQMLHLVEQVPNLEVFIFSGEAPEAVKRALLGEPHGTRICRSLSSGLLPALPPAFS